MTEIAGESTKSVMAEGVKSKKRKSVAKKAYTDTREGKRKHLKNTARALRAALSIFADEEGTEKEKKTENNLRMLLIKALTELQIVDKRRHLEYASEIEKLVST